MLNNWKNEREPRFVWFMIIDVYSFLFYSLCSLRRCFCGHKQLFFIFFIRIVKLFNDMQGNFLVFPLFTHLNRRQWIKRKNNKILIMLLLFTTASEHFLELLAVKNKAYEFIWIWMSETLRSENTLKWIQKRYLFAFIHFPI